MSYEMIAGHDSRAGIDFIRFSGRSSVRAFLSGFLKDYFNIIMLRQVVQEGATGSYLRRTNDQAVVDRLADLVILGRLRIVKVPSTMPTWSGTQVMVAETTVPSFEPEAEGPIPVSTEETVVRYSLYVRLPIDPNQAESVDDKFTLFGGRNVDDCEYEQVQTTSDDIEKGDDCVDLIFKNLIPNLSYWLEVDPGKDGEKYFAFENMGWGQIEPVARS